MSFTDTAWSVFTAAINDYHLWDDVNAPSKNNYPLGTLEQMLYEKNWIDTVQWHLEDLIRDERIEPAVALQLKRRIDASNQHRTDVVEHLDYWFYEKYAGVKPSTNARINTETPAWAVDRLSILALKIFHMNLEANRIGASAEHHQTCSEKLLVLRMQKEDLCQAIEQLLANLEDGSVKMKLYKQMKMYNDKNLNPILYQKG